MVLHCPRFRLSFESFVEFSMCSYERAAGSVPEISVFPTVLHCLLYFPHHKNPIDTALGLKKAMVDVKVIVFVFRHICFVS